MGSKVFTGHFYCDCGRVFSPHIEEWTTPRKVNIKIDLAKKYRENGATKAACNNCGGGGFPPGYSRR